MKANDLLERFAVELSELDQGELIQICLSPLDIWIIMSNLQLALRHPQNKGITSKRVKELALMFQGLVADKGALKEMAELGWNPEYDI